MTTATSPGKGRLARLIGRRNKPVFLRFAVWLARVAAQHAVALKLLAWYVDIRIHKLSPRKADSALRILVLNEERWRPDLQELGRHPDAELAALPSTIQHMVNAICLSPIRHLTDGDTIAFRAQQRPEIRAAREALRRLIAGLLEELRQRRRIDAIATCTFYYAQDREWEAACREIGLPFVVMHKENMKDPAIHEQAITRYHKYLYHFGADRLFLFNTLERDLILKAGAASQADLPRISVVGGLRMDTIHRRKLEQGAPPPRRQVTLFSSHHCIGLLTLSGAKGFFSPDRSEGFTEWFDQTHATIARLAARHGDVEFWIKPKWMGEWADKIRDAIRREAGFNVDDLPNLHISIERSAHQLIEDSAVVVGLNSTTLLEAKLYDRPVVVPLLAEAAGKHYEKHVYFKSYLNDVFTVARSPQELERMIIDELEGRGRARTMPPQMISDYLGFFDGQVAERIVATIRAAVENAARRKDGSL